MNEADTCRTYILPNLKSAGWEDETITEQLVLTPGRTVAYLDGLQAKVNALIDLQTPSLHFGDCHCFPGTAHDLLSKSGRCARRSERDAVCVQKN